MSGRMKKVVGLAGEHVDTFVGQLDAAVLLVDYEVERIGDDRHLLVVVLHVESLGLEQERLDAVLAQVFDERTVFRQTLEGAEEQQCAFLALILVVGCDFLLGIGEQRCHKAALRVDHCLYVRLELVKHLVVAFGNRTGDDERRTGVVDKH